MKWLDDLVKSAALETQGYQAGLGMARHRANLQFGTGTPLVQTGQAPQGFLGQLSNLGRQASSFAQQVGPGLMSQLRQAMPPSSTSTAAAPRPAVGGGTTSAMPTIAQPASAASSSGSAAAAASRTAPAPEPKAQAANSAIGAGPQASPLPSAGARPAAPAASAGPLGGTEGAGSTDIGARPPAPPRPTIRPASPAPVAVPRFSADRYNAQGLPPGVGSSSAIPARPAGLGRAVPQPNRATNAR